MFKLSLIFLACIIVGCGDTEEITYNNTSLPQEVNPLTCSTQINEFGLDIICLENRFFLYYNDYRIVEIIELCQYNGEVIIRLDNGDYKWLKLDNNRAGLKRVPAGYYETTDGEYCRFEVI